MLARVRERERYLNAGMTSGGVSTVVVVPTLQIDFLSSYIIIGSNNKNMSKLRFPLLPQLNKTQTTYVLAVRG